MAYKIVETLLDRTHNFRNRELYSFINQTDGKWVSTSWKSFLGKTEAIARGLLDDGVRPGDRVAVCSPNSPHILSIDYALYMIRAVSVPVGHVESQQVVDHILDLTEAEVIFVGDASQYALISKYLETHPDNKVRRIVMIRDREEDRRLFSPITENIFELMARGDDEPTRNELKKRMEEGVPSDVAMIVFTTGTTGMPKGVVLCHEQLDASIGMHDKFLSGLKENMVSLSYLPMSHIFEKGWLYLCVRYGLRIVFCYDTSGINEMLRTIKPDVMCCVPRFWEKLYSCFFDYYNSQSWFKRRLMKRAFYVGKQRNLYYRRSGKKVPAMVEREYRFWDKRVFSLLREQSGLINPGIYPTAGSMLNDKIMGFMLKAGFDILLGYGLTETTATVTIFPWYNPIVGTVGRPLDDIRVRIADNGEILVKGPTVMKGYYKDEEATRAAIDSDGYFHTGDLGFLNADGSLVISGRIKDMYKTSTGKTIPPLLVESTLMESPLIARAVAVADARKYCTALVYPDIKRLRAIASREKWVYADDSELLSLPQTKEVLMKEIEECQKHLSRYMHVRNIAVMHRDLTRESGEISISGKLRRKVIRDNFIDIIDTLYPNENIDAEPMFESHQPK